MSQFNAAMIGAQRVVHQAAGGVVNAMSAAERKQAQAAANMKAGWAEATGAVRTHSAELDRVGTGMVKAGALVGLGLAASAKAAMSWESAFAGVRKTVDELDPGFASLEGQLRSLARGMATSHEDIAAVAENAGALGVATKDISRFTQQMIILGETTNVTADEASTYMAQLMTIMGTAPEKVGRLAAALVDLGNNGASTEAQILEMSQRIAGAGRAVGLTEAQVMGFASAIASTGINVEAGGSAISRVFTNLDRIVTDGGAKLQTLNDLVGGDFATAFRQDASSAVVTFIEALGRLQERGGSITSVLDDIGIKQIYQTDVIRRLAGAHTLLADQVGISERAMTDGTAALVEYGKRMETAESRAAVAWNNIKDAAIEFGQEMLPIVADAADGLSEMMGTFQGLPGPAKAAAVQLAGVTAAALLLGGGALKAVVAGVKLVDTFKGFAASAPRAAAGMKRAAIAAVALAAATVALRAYGRALDDAAEASRTKWADIAAGMLKSFGQNTTLDLDSMLSFEEGAVFKKTTTGLGASLKRAFDSSWADSFGDFMNQAVFSTSTAGHIKGQIGEIDRALAGLVSSGNADAAAAGFRQIAEAAASEGVAIEAVLPHLGEYRRSLEQVVDSLGLQGQISESEFIDWMGGKVPAAVRQAIDANSELTGNLTDQQKEWLGLNKEIEKTIKSMREYSDIALALMDSRVGVRKAFEDGLSDGRWEVDSKGRRTGEITGGILRGGGFSENKQSGRHNIAQISSMAGAANAALADLKEGGADVSKLTTETEKWRKKLVEAYVAGGKNKDVAAALAEAYISIEGNAPTFEAPGLQATSGQVEDLNALLEELPDLAQTEIAAPGARPSKQEVQDFVDQIHDVPPETVALVKTVAELSGVDAAQEALDRLRDKLVYVRVMQTGGNTPGGNRKAADGAVFSFADGGMLPPIGAQRPRIEHNRGERGIQWAETGAGPWEGFVSGHPAKKQRSRQVTEEIAGRLGGDVMWRAADGGILSMPTYKGKGLDYWEDALLTPLELTRLKIRIRNLQNDLKATETYKSGGRKKKRKKLRGLDRTEATLELAELRKELADAQTAAQADKANEGTIAARLDQHKLAEERARDADSIANSVRSRNMSGLSVGTGYQRRQDAAGNVWYTSGHVSAASLEAKARKEADNQQVLFGKLEALARAGASRELMDELLNVDGVEDQIRIADAYLANRGALAGQNQAYADMGVWSEKIGKLVAATPNAGTAGTAGTAGGAVVGSTFNIVNNYPQAEPTSLTIYRARAADATIGETV